MCGVVHLSAERIPDRERRLAMMNELQRHRGPDGGVGGCTRRGRLALPTVR